MILVGILAFIGLLSWVYLRDDKPRKTNILTVLALFASSIIIYNIVMELQGIGGFKRLLGVFLYGTFFLFFIEIIRYLYILYIKLSIKHININPKLLWYIPILLLIITILPLPIWYYQILRIIMVAISLLLAFKNYDKNIIATIVFVGIAIIFNPFFPIYLEKPIWSLIDIVTAIYFAINSIHFFQNEQDNSINTSSYQPIDNIFKKFWNKNKLLASAICIIIASVIIIQLLEGRDHKNWKEQVKYDREWRDTCAETAQEPYDQCYEDVSYFPEPSFFE